MVSEDAATKVLEHIKKQGPTNTFRLATELGIDRHKILNIIKKLEEKQAIEIRSGVAKFLKFPREEKAIKILEVKKAPSKPKKEVKHKKTVLETIQAENKRLKEKLSELQNAPPRIIRRTIVKKVPKIIEKIIIKKIPVKIKEEKPKKKIKFKFPKINLSGLGKNIKRLHVPEMLKK